MQIAVSRLGTSLARINNITDTSHSSPMDRRGESKKGAAVQSQAPPTQSIYDLIGEPNTSVNEVRYNVL